MHNPWKNDNSCLQHVRTFITTTARQDWWQKVCQLTKFASNAHQTLIEKFARVLSWQTLCKANISGSGRHAARMPNYRFQHTNENNYELVMLLVQNYAWIWPCLSAIAAGAMQDPSQNKQNWSLCLQHVHKCISITVRQYLWQRFYLHITLASSAHQPNWQR